MSVDFAVKDNVGCLRELSEREERREREWESKGSEDCIFREKAALRFDSARVLV